MVRRVIAVGFRCPLCALRVLYQKKRSKLCGRVAAICVVVRGFEPRQTEPKPVVLPLHHTTIRCMTLPRCEVKAVAKVSLFFETTKCFLFLLHADEEIVLLALLCQDVFACYEVIGCERTVLVGEFLLVDRDTASLHHLAHLTL